MARWTTPRSSLALALPLALAWLVGCQAQPRRELVDADEPERLDQDADADSSVEPLELRCQSSGPRTFASSLPTTTLTSLDHTVLDLFILTALVGDRAELWVLRSDDWTPLTKTPLVGVRSAWASYDRYSSDLVAVVEEATGVELRTYLFTNELGLLPALAAELCEGCSASRTSPLVRTGWSHTATEQPDQGTVRLHFASHDASTPPRAAEPLEGRAPAVAPGTFGPLLLYLRGGLLQVAGHHWDGALAEPPRPVDDSVTLRAFTSATGGGDLVAVAVITEGSELLLWLLDGQGRLSGRVSVATLASPQASVALCVDRATIAVFWSDQDASGANETALWYSAHRRDAPAEQAGPDRLDDRLPWPAPPQLVATTTRTGFTVAWAGFADDGQRTLQSAFVDCSPR